MQLKNKVALVTGGNHGLGSGIVLAYVKEGAKVVFCGRNEKNNKEVLREIEKLGGEGLPIKCDVSSSHEVKEMFDKVLEKFGTLDILVNNAAKVPDSGATVERRQRHYALLTQPIPRQSLQITKDMSDEEWLSYFDVNIHGTFYCTREALKIMEEKKYGKIINIASIAGISGLSAHSPHYSASKGAVVAFTKSLAAEVAGAGICVNCIAPGGIMTPAMENMIANMDEKTRSTFFQLVLSGRIGEVEEYASLAVYLASDGASYMVGQIISPNGGFYI